MHMKSRARTFWPLDRPWSFGIVRSRCEPRDRPDAPAAPPQNPPARVTLDQAIDLAIQHNHSLQAARTTILQNQAQEITANLRPNPVLLGDTQFLPFFHAQQFHRRLSGSTARNSTWASATCSSGAKKRQHRLQAAKDQTAVTTATGGRQRADADVQRRLAIHFGRCSRRPIWIWPRKI